MVRETFAPFAAWISAKGRRMLEWPVENYAAHSCGAWPFPPPLLTHNTQQTCEGEKWVLDTMSNKPLGNMTIAYWLVALTILKNIGQWEGLSHILWKIKNV